MDDNTIDQAAIQALRKILEDSYIQEVEKKKLEFKIVGLDPDNSPQAIETFYIMDRNHKEIMKKLDKANKPKNTFSWLEENKRNGG